MATRSAGQRSSQKYRKSQKFKAAARALGLRIRELRTDRDWTLEKAAENMDLDLKHLQKVEAGQLNVTLVTLLRIADGLKEPVASLFSNVKKPR